MSIKIIPADQIAKQNDKMGIISNITLLFYPNPKMLYMQRAKRMAVLAKKSPFADYLNFCAKIVLAQAKLVEYSPVSQDLTTIVEFAIKNNLPPLSIDNYPLNEQWITYLHTILEAVQDVNEQINQEINDLKQKSTDELLIKANQLLNGQFDLVTSNESLFIWSALSVYYSQLANQLPGKAIANTAEQRWLCPVCQHSPIASIVHIGANLGLRYLHCSLCESEWYVPRAKCTNCDNMENITYFSLDEALSSIKTECCSKCHSYLKIFNQEKDAYLDIVADDINSLILDMETEREKFAKSGINPLLFSEE